MESSLIQDSLRRFEEDLRKLGLPGDARGILIGASGGPDSTALCRLLALARDRSRSPTGWPPTWLGHVHHGLRGAEADADADFVRALAGQLRFGHLEARVDLQAGRRGLGQEGAARAARYSAFSRWTALHPIDVVAVAHTADDQAETVILRILRRAGLRGLSGMPRERPLSAGQAGRSPRLVRPLLDWRRDEALTLLANLGQRWREDSTNRSEAILRNRIRHRLLPVLRSDYQASADAALLEVARIAGEAARDLAEIARNAIDRTAVRLSPDHLRIDESALRAIPPSARPFAVEILAGKFPGAREGPLSLRRMAEFGQWFEDRRAGKRTMDLGGGLTAELFRGAVTLRATDRPDPPPGSPPSELTVPGSVKWRGWEIRAELMDPEASRPGEGSAQFELVDRSALTGPLEVRSRRPGDRFRPLGAPGSKKLKEFLRERGVGEEMRDRVPLVADARGIVWVVGHRLADPFKLRPSTREMVKLSAVPAEESRKSEVGSRK